MLGHFIWYHVEQDLSNFKEFFCNEQCFLSVKEEIFKLEENVCLGVLMYARKKE